MNNSLSTDLQFLILPWDCYNKEVLAVTCVFLINQDVNNNLGMNGLTEAIFKMLGTENKKRPKLWFSITQLLIIIELQYSPLNVYI